MKTFMAVYTGTPEARQRSGWDQLDEAARKARERQGMEAWMAWGEKHRESIVQQGSPLGKTTRVSREGLEETSNNLAAWTLVRAESREAAARLFENHPHFTIFPGDAVEVMECLPIPTMPR